MRFFTIDNAGHATGKQALVSVTTVAKVGVLTAGANVGVVNCVVSRPTSDGTGVLVITAPVLGRRLLLALIERRNGPDGAQAVSAPVANVTPGPYCGTAFNPGNFFLAPAFNVAAGAVPRRRRLTSAPSQVPDPRSTVRVASAEGWAMQGEHQMRRIILAAACAAAFL